MRQTAINFQGKGGQLEGVVGIPDGFPLPHPAVVLCHPHPALGGSMESPVVLAMAKALDQRGIGSLRFNFRGVGESQGEFTNGQVEWRDVAAALEVLKRWPGIDRRRLAVAGYSFGALAVAKGAKEIKDAAVLVLVSPPLSAFAGSSIGQDKRPRLFLVGGRDRLVDAQALQNAVEGFSGLVEVEVTPGADHTWRGYEAALGDAVAAFASRHFW